MGNSEDLKVRAPNVSTQDLERQFEVLCKVYGVVSRGMKPEDITAPIDGDAYDGTEQWAMKRTRLGWMIVCGKGGFGSVFSRWNGYTRTKWDFLMLIEALTQAHHTMRRLAEEKSNG